MRDLPTGHEALGLRLGYSEIGEFRDCLPPSILSAHSGLKPTHTSTDAGTLFGLPRKIGKIGTAQRRSAPCRGRRKFREMSPLAFSFVRRARFGKFT